MDGRSKVGTHSPRVRTASRRHLPRFDTVEQRLLLSAFTVTNTDDFGDGSLRQAIFDNNSNPGANTISFNIPGTGPQVIKPLSPLPAITNPVVIDGYTQPGAVPNTATQGDNATIDIVIDGSGIGEWSRRTGLQVKADNSTIRGLAVDNFDVAGVIFVGSGDHLEGSFIGVDASGKTAQQNGLGVGVLGGSAVIGGTSLADRNLISGNIAGIGIASLSMGGSSFLTAQPGSTVQNNLIGTDAKGTGDLGNGTIGLGVVGSGNVIGGTGAGMANTIAFNGKAGAALNLGGGVVVAGLDSASFSPALVSSANLISGNAIYANHGLGIAQVTIPIATLLPLMNTSTASIPSVVMNLLTQVKVGSAGIIPDLTSAIDTHGVTTVRGTIAGAASTAYQVQFFANSGQTFLGQTSVTTAASGAGAIAFKAPASVTTGQVITATSIDPSNNTSGFSNSVTVASPAPPSLAPIADQTVAEGGTVSLTATGTDADPSQVLTYTASAGTINASTGAFAYVAPSGPATKAVTISVTDQSSPAQTVSQTFTIHVTNVAPTVVLGGDASVLPGKALSRTGSFTDPGAQTSTATVDYGDGSGPAPLALNADKTFALSHTYKATGTYAVTVNVKDSGGATGTSSFKATVIPKPVQVTAPINLTITKKTITGIGVHFNGSVNGAGNAGNYQLAILTTKKTKQGLVTTAKPVGIKSVNYDGGSQVATILPLTKLSASKVYQLTVVAAGIQDTHGQVLDGNGDGTAGGNLVANLAKGSATILGA